MLMQHGSNHRQLEQNISSSLAQPRPFCRPFSSCKDTHSILLLCKTSWHEARQYKLCRQLETIKSLTSILTRLKEFKAATT